MGHGMDVKVLVNAIDNFRVALENSTRLTKSLEMKIEVMSSQMDAMTTQSLEAKIEIMSSQMEAMAAQIKTSIPDVNGTQEPRCSEQKPQLVESVLSNGSSAASVDATTMKEGNVVEFDLSSVSTVDEVHGVHVPSSCSSAGSADAKIMKDSSKGRFRSHKIASDSSVVIIPSKVAGLKKLMGDGTIQTRMVVGKGLQQTEKLQVGAPTLPLPIVGGSGQSISHGGTRVNDNETKPSILKPVGHCSSVRSASVHFDSCSDSANLHKKRALVRSAVSQWESLARDKVQSDHLKAWPFATPVRSLLLKSG